MHAYQYCIKCVCVFNVCVFCFVLSLQLSHTLTSELFPQQQSTADNRLVHSNTQIHGSKLAFVPCFAFVVY